MPFNLLLLSDDIPLRTSISDSGNTVSIKPQPNEHVAGWKLDEPSSLIHDALMEMVTNNQRICEGLFIFRNNNKMIVCLVELKGKDVSHAVTQLLNTKQIFSGLLQSSLNRTQTGRKLFKSIEWRAYIKQKGRSSSPNRKKKNKNQTNGTKDELSLLDAAFQERRISKNTDIGQFLRS